VHEELVTRAKRRARAHAAKHALSRVARTMRTLIGFLSALFIATSASAVTYTENFDDGVANGWTDVGTWAVQGSTYRSTGIGPNDIAVYGGDTWDTSFTFRARLYNAYHADGNLVGMVYKYRNANNYLAVKFAPTGEAYLIRVIGGTETVITGSHQALGSGVWFTVDVIRSGTRTTVKVDGATVFNSVNQNHLHGAGKIGLITTFAEARFNNVSVTQRALFATGFEGNLTLSDPDVDCQPAEGNTHSSCWQDVGGTDSVTGHTFPIRMWGTSPSRIHMILGFANPTPSDPISNYTRNQITEGRLGGSALYQEVIARDPGGWCCTQNVFEIYPGANQREVYLSYWLKLEEGFAERLTQGDPWRVVSEFKPVESGTPARTRYRMALRISDWDGPGDNNPPRFGVLADNNPGCIWDYEDPDTIAVPTGWFRVEIFWRRHVSNGRYWVAINGETLFNRDGERTMADDAQPIEKLFPFLAYSGGGVPIAQWVDDFEIWDRFPTTASPHSGLPSYPVNEGCK
jgi:hypothetical protein